MLDSIKLICYNLVIKKLSFLSSYKSINVFPVHLIDADKGIGSSDICRGLFFLFNFIHSLTQTLIDCNKKLSTDEDIINT
jgi:hypothetical protein